MDHHHYFRWTAGRGGSDEVANLKNKKLFSKVRSISQLYFPMLTV
jgi:hypothetical protein